METPSPSKAPSLSKNENCVFCCQKWAQGLRPWAALQIAKPQALGHIFVCTVAFPRVLNVGKSHTNHDTQSQQSLAWPVSLLGLVFAVEVFCAGSLAHGWPIGALWGGGPHQSGHVARWSFFLVETGCHCLYNLHQHWWCTNAVKHCTFTLHPIPSGQVLCNVPV